ncbi:MAG: hypothetical protein ACKVQA_22465 [Burkholderiales bacterium]
MNMPFLYRTLLTLSKAVQYLPWRKHSLYAMLALGIVSNANESAAGEALAARADAVLVLEVSFLPYGHLVLLREVLYGDKNSLPDPIQYLGVCLPRKPGVVWLAEQARGPAVRIYREAIEQATYTAVLFLKSEVGSINPVCDESINAPEHWSTHPNHSAWREKVVAALRKRTDR